eukprot:scaffold6934_cov121-Isochrysis_galbana.AAC.11
MSRGTILGPMAQPRPAALLATARVAKRQNCRMWCGRQAVTQRNCAMMSQRTSVSSSWPRAIGVAAVSASIMGPRTARWS